MSTRNRPATPWIDPRSPQQGWAPVCGGYCRVLRVTRPYMCGPDVLAVQGALQARGYHPGPVDGVYEGETRQAVTYFQDDQNIQGPAGVVTREVYDTLGIRCTDVIQPNPFALVYNNPFAQGTEVAWYDGKKVVSIDFGKIETSPENIRWAKEYIPVYGVDSEGNPEFVPEQLYIYGSAPGEPEYSPIWRYYWVIVPRTYVPNTLRSQKDVLDSGYPVVETDILTNGPIL